MNSKIDLYLEDGCGRCALYKTPQCKVIPWRTELSQLRRIALECGLKEELKWSVPCYTYKGKNIIIVSALKNFATLSFFKGSLLNDKKKELIAPGKNSQATKYFKFTDVKTILDKENIIKNYIYEAIEIEKAGLNVKYKTVILSLSSVCIPQWPEDRRGQ